MNVEALISHYTEKKMKGELDFSDIRKQLIDKGISESEISELIKKIDHEIITIQNIHSTKKNGKLLYLLGIGLVAFGIVKLSISIYSYLFQDGYIKAVIIPFIVGIPLISIGRNRMRALNRVKGIKHFGK